MKTGKYLVLKKENLAKNTYSLWIKCPEVAQEAQAGQFVHVKVEGFSLRRPISICEVTEKAIRIVFDVRGEGTEAMTRINQGDMIDLLAPLGHGFTLLEPEKPFVVLGGRNRRSTNVGSGKTLWNTSQSDYWIPNCLQSDFKGRFHPIWR